MTQGTSSGEAKPAAKQEAEGAPKRRALGKGLESLLSTRAPAETTAKFDAIIAERPWAGEAKEPDQGGKPREIPLDQIDPNPYQPRMHMDAERLEELSKSIAVNGVVQPIVVRPLPNGRFQLIAGERRWRASEKAGKKTVPAILRQVSDVQAMEMTIIENLQRADLNPMEQARAYDRLSREFEMTQEQMSTRTGTNRATIGNFLRLLKLPKEVQSRLESGELSFGHAKCLGALISPESILNATTKITTESMSVRQAEIYIQRLLKIDDEGEQSEQKEKPIDPNVREAQEKLQRQLGLKVRIQDKNGKGRVVIEYSGLEDFDSLMAAFGADA